MSNPDILLEYLKKVGKATSAEIYRDCGIWRVSDCCFKLRNRAVKVNSKGYGECYHYPYRDKLITTMIKAKNRRNQDVWIAEYSLK